MTEHQKRERAKTFAEEWSKRGYEKGDSQPFWLSLLRDICGVEEPEQVIRFEEQVHLDHTSFIDGYIDATKVMIEQKSAGKDLNKAIKQSDGSMLTPFQQAKRYASELPYSKRPRWIVTSNFREIYIYDMERPQGEPERINVADLGTEYYRLGFLTDTGNERIKRELEVSLQAGELVGRLYDMLLKQYNDPTNPETLKSLNKLCVRLVFCLYAEDAGIFGKRDMFVDYLKGFNARNVRTALIELFRVLNTPQEERDPYLNPDLLAFPYVNGGLFAEEHIEIPTFTAEIVEMIEEDCSLNFDWSGISPTIFGGVFESTLNPVTRRSGGMHYTSIENIHKVIDPLFLDGLKRELAEILDVAQPKVRERRLHEFQDKLASLTFLDPACGSGNFLTETYLSLRRLENEVIEALSGGQMMWDFKGSVSPIKVSINQFHGIEINDFAVTVAQTALWISEAQMQQETEDIIHADLQYLPLRRYDNIVEGNALAIDWDDVVSRDRLDYIIGNPPFVGARFMDAAQKESLMEVFGPKWKNAGNLDFVSAWYKKSADMMQGAGERIRGALVSTNSVCQGESVANLWKPLFAEGVHIDFAHRTFRWDSESSQKAHVHCVIVGFSKALNDTPRRIFTDGRPVVAKNINAYLIDADDVFVESRNTPICDVPQIGIGNKPIDDGNYLFSREEMEEFVKREPKSAAYFKPFYGAQEFINRRPRYCLWLGECSPTELRTMPLCMERVKNVREFRLSSKSEGTRKLADRPTRFHVENMPKGNYLLIPQVSSERRKYVPIGFMTPDNICSDKVRLMPEADLFMFGVLTSNVHMAWMRAVCCRLKSDYSYTVNNVYNTFPWPESVSDAQRAKIEKTAQGILDARALYPEASYADLYDETVMPAELRKAHQDNDRAVMEAYGFPIKDFTESQCVARLMEMYQSQLK